MGYEGNFGNVTSLREASKKSEKLNFFVKSTEKHVGAFTPYVYKK